MKKIVIILILLWGCFGYSQQNIETIKASLDELAKTQEGLNDIIVSEITDISLSALLTSIALEHNVNLDVDPNLNQKVEANFHNASVKETLVYLIQRHNLDTEFINKFIVIRKKAPVIEAPVKPKPKLLDIKFREDNLMLSLNLKNDSLQSVAKDITKKTKENIVVSPSLKDKTVTGYFQNRPLDDILGMLAMANGLSISKNENGSYFIDKDVIPKKDNGSKQNNKRRTKPKSKKGESGYYEITLSDTGFLNIKSYQGNVADMLIEAADQLKLNYYLNSIPDDITATLIVNEVSFEDFLEHAFKGSDYTYTQDDKGFYLIGKRSDEGLRVTELVQLENRTIEKIEETIPKTFKEGLTIKSFKELNGFIVSGSKPSVDEFKIYIKQIDKVVPMVQLEVMIVQYNKSHDVQTGMKAGLDNQPKTTSGVLFPTGDINLNAQSVNGLIDIFNGLVGEFNLGKVTEQFYLNLKFLENNSIIKLESTPKVSTLSGHEATLTIGETSYYFQQNNQFVPFGNTNTVAQSGTWEPTEANLNINIKPIVSKDEQITLELNVEKSSFLGRVGEDAPPGKATQKFESTIRAKNNEMVLLGGLDELNNENSGTGVPVLSRVPVLKWFFSGRSKKKSKSKLHLFVKPIVTY